MDRNAMQMKKQQQQQQQQQEKNLFFLFLASRPLPFLLTMLRRGNSKLCRETQKKRKEKKTEEKRKEKNSTRRLISDFLLPGRPYK